MKSWSIRVRSPRIFFQSRCSEEKFCDNILTRWIFRLTIPACSSDHATKNRSRSRQFRSCQLSSCQVVRIASRDFSLCGRFGEKTRRRKTVQKTDDRISQKRHHISALPTARRDGRPKTFMPFVARLAANACVTNRSITNVRISRSATLFVGPICGSHCSVSFRVGSLMNKK